MCCSICGMNRVPRRGMSGKRKQSRLSKRFGARGTRHRGGGGRTSITPTIYRRLPMRTIASAADSGPIIYATHPYPFKGTPPHVEPDWDRYFGNVSRDARHPGEYGVDEMIMDAQAARLDGTTAPLHRRKRTVCTCVVGWRYAASCAWHKWQRRGSAVESSRPKSTHRSVRNRSKSLDEVSAMVSDFAVEPR